MELSLAMKEISVGSRACGSPAGPSGRCRTESRTARRLSAWSPAASSSRPTTFAIASSLKSLVNIYFFSNSIVFALHVRPRT